MILRKVRILSWLPNSRIVQGIFQFYQLGRCSAQSRNSSDKVRICQNCTCTKLEWFGENACMSRDMRFPTMWHVRPAKAQISLRICAD